jgi:hypothetical protein
MRSYRLAFSLLFGLGIWAVNAAAAESEARPFQILTRTGAGVGLLVLYLAAAAALLALSVVVLSLWPAPFRERASTIETSPWRCVLLGAGGMIILLLLAATIIGHMPRVAPFVLFFEAFILWAAFINGALALGKRMLFEINSAKSDLPVWNLFAGGALLLIGVLLPVIGWLCGFFALLAGVGGLLATPFAGRTRPAGNSTENSGNTKIN